MVRFVKFLQLLCILWCLFNQVAADPTVVSLTNGKYQGEKRDYFYAFEGIPYAEAPVGENRFEPPKPYTETWDDIREVKKYGSICMQWDQFTEVSKRPLGNEDCLFVNVYVPESVIKSGVNAPVIFYIYGG